jgi:hypothetical protein
MYSFEHITKKISDRHIAALNTTGFAAAEARLIPHA